MGIEDIIKGCKEGNRKCQDALVQKFAPGLLALCIRYTSDRETARDALQECFINTFRYIDKFDGRGSFEGWIRRIAVTCSISTQKKFSAFYLEEINDQSMADHVAIPEVYTQLGTADIMKILKILPDRLYLVFNLYVVEGYNHGEIAALLNITESTSRAALCKARNRLIEALKKQEQGAVAKAS